MPEVVRPVNEIQAAVMTATEEIEAVSEKVGLARLMTELERNYPGDLDKERVGEGEVCPPLAWAIHADVGNAKILLEEVVQSLTRASRLTQRQVRREWLEEKLKEVGNTSTQALLAFLIGIYADSDFIPDVQGLGRALVRLSHHMRDLEGAPEGRALLARINENIEGIQAHLEAIGKIMSG